MQNYVSSKKSKQGPSFIRSFTRGRSFAERKVLWKDASYLALYFKFFSEVVLKKKKKGRVNNQNERSYWMKEFWMPYFALLTLFVLTCFVINDLFNNCKNLLWKPGISSSHFKGLILAASEYFEITLTNAESTLCMRSL